MPIILNRKKKDTQGIADVKSGKTKSYVTISRRAKNPETGNRIRKGSTVTMGQSSRLAGFTSAPKPIKVSISNPSMQVRSSLVPADFNDGKVNKRTTDMSFVKKYGENPEKVKMRMSAQSSGKPTYNYKGKEELSGISKTTIKTTPGQVSVSFGKKPVPIMAPAAKLNVSSPVPSTKSNNKPMAMTMGGTVKGDHPANKFGTGKRSGFKLKRKQVFK